MHFPHGTCQQYEWPFKPGHTRINPLKWRLHVCLHGIDSALHGCHGCWQAPLLNDDLFSDCTCSMTWQIAVKFMYGFPWWFLCKFHTSLARSLHSTMSGKEIFLHSVNWTRGGNSHSAFTFWMTAAMFVFAKVHLNPYELNCILLHLIHLKNALTSDRESTVLNPGDEHYRPAKVDVAGCAFPLSIRQLLIQLSNH